MVYGGHKRYHAVMDSGIIERIKRMTREEYEFFERILPELESYTERILDDRRG